MNEATKLPCAQSRLDRTRTFVTNSNEEKQEAVHDSKKKKLGRDGARINGLSMTLRAEHWGIEDDKNKSKIWPECESKRIRTWQRNSRSIT